MADVQTRTARPISDFQLAAAARQIAWWPTRACSLCGYPCGYSCFAAYVIYDAGCYCTNRDGGELRSWSDVADFYNLQTAASVIADMDAFWGFPDTR